MTEKLSVAAMQDPQSIFCFHVAHWCLEIWEKHLLSSSVRNKIPQIFTKLSKLKNLVHSHIRTTLLGQEGVYEQLSPVVNSDADDDVDTASTDVTPRSKV